MPLRVLRALVLACAILPVAGAATGQGLSLGEPVAPSVGDSDVLVIDFERAFSESAFGKRVSADLEEEGARIAAENRKIEAQLVDEERTLTELRPQMDPAEFRERARAFDEKVQRLRREQDAKGRALGNRSEAARRLFVESVQPVLATLMQETGAAVILERRIVFVALDSVDVTDAAIARIDAVIGQGPPLPQVPEPSAPGQTAPDDPVPGGSPAPAPTRIPDPQPPVAPPVPAPSEP